MTKKTREVPLRRSLSVEDYVSGVLQGERTALAQAITLLESTAPAHEAVAQEVLARILPRSGKALRVGITGAPGVGKSCLVQALGLHLINLGKRVAVLAVDPSSTVSGGSILADKTRMPLLAREERAFIRPTPAGQFLGGVARATREAIFLVEAAGFDVVLVETVGVGQSEGAVHSMVDFFLLLLLAGAGDELQGIKRGVIELADALAITKADGDNAPRAEKARAEYVSALQYLSPLREGWTVAVLSCSAVTGAGIADLWQAMESHRQQGEKTGGTAKRRREQALHWLHAIIAERLEKRFFSHPAVKVMLPELEQAVVEGQLAPSTAALRLLRASRAGGEKRKDKDSEN